MSLFLKTLAIALPFIFFTFNVKARSFDDNLNVVVHSPSSNAIVNKNLLYIEATVLSVYQLKEVKAIVKNLEVSLFYNPNLQKFVGEMTLSSLPHGDLSLIIVVRDVKEDKDSTSIHFVFDIPPTIEIITPVVDNIVQGSLKIKGYGKDFEGVCKLDLSLFQPNTNSVHFLGSYYDSIDTEIGFSQLQGQMCFLQCTATDSLNQTTKTEIRIYFDSSPRLKKVASSPAQILDFYNDRILYSSNNPSTTYLFSLESQASLKIPIPTYKIHSIDSSEILADSDDGLYYYNYLKNLSVFIGPMNGDEHYAKKVGKYVIWEHRDFAISPLNAIKKLYFKDLEKNVAFLVQDSAYLRSDLTDDGRVIYSAPKHMHELFQYEDGISTELTATIDTLGNIQPLSDAGRIVYAKSNIYYHLRSEERHRFCIALWDGNKERILTGFRTIQGKFEDQFKNFYQISNGWIAYVKPHDVGQDVIMLNKPNGEEIVIGASSYIEGVSPTGEVMYFNNNKRYHSDSLGNITEISSAYGTAKWANNKWRIAILRTLFEVELELPEFKSEDIEKKLAKGDTLVVLSLSDFTTAFKGASLLRIKFNSLPSNGSIVLRESPITMDKTYSIDSIQQIRYIPNKSFSGKEKFTWSGATMFSSFSNISAIKIKVEQPLGSIDSYSNSDLHVYPNPSNNEVKFELKNQYIGALTIQLIGMNCKVLRTKRMEKDSYLSYTTLSLESLNSGLYILKISGSNFVINKRILIQK